MISNYRSDPTANAAIGAADKELKVMRRRAEQLKILHKKGQLSPVELARARRQFVGIYARLLRDALKP